MATQNRKTCLRPNELLSLPASGSMTTCTSWYAVSVQATQTSGESSAVVSCGMATATIVESIDAISSADAARAKKIWRAGACRVVGVLSVVAALTPGQARRCPHHRRP